MTTRLRSALLGAATLLLLLAVGSACEPEMDPTAPPDTERTPAPGVPDVQPSSASHAPVAIPDSYVTDEGTPLVVPAPGVLANDLDPDGDAVSFATFLVPANGTVTGTNPDGSFTYTPNPGFSGTEEFTYRIVDDDGNLSEPSTISVEVLPDPNRNPVPVADGYSTSESTPLVVSAPGVLANDLDPDGDAITFAQFTVPANGTITGTNPDGSFTYTPDSGFTGTEEFTYRIVDDNGNLSEPAPISITVVAPGGDTPVIVADGYETTEGTPLVVAAPGVLANDFDPNGDPIFFSQFSFPANGSVTGTSPDGSFTYTPDSGFTGTEAIGYRITDSNLLLSDQGTFFVTVHDPNRDPVAVGDVFVTMQDEALTVPAPGVLANDLDADGDAIFFSQFSFPANGSVTGTSNDGSFTYTPDPGFTGTEAFGYRIVDDQGNLSDQGTIRIVVLAPVDLTPPEIVGPSGPLVLWPPNHRLHRITVADLVQAVTDEGDPGLSSADVVIAQVTSDEADSGMGDGDTSGDVVIGASCEWVDLRAERAGNGDGRVYTVELAVADAAGNVGTASVEVHVPPSKGAPASAGPAAEVVGGCSNT